MKQYLKIQSKGEIEKEAFTLIGASSKRTSTTKIGYYGSGLKYSIASMLRNHISFRVFRGTHEVLFTTSGTKFREEEYEIICVDGEKTSLAVGMGGKDWDLPFAPIREIYSNALDEDTDAKLDQSEADALAGEAGFTTFYIEMTEKVRHFYDNMFFYFCNNNPAVIHSNDSGSIYPAAGPGLRLFRRGILSHQTDDDVTLYWYNSKHFEINESRVINSIYAAKKTVSEIWKNCKDLTLIGNLIEGLAGGDKGKWEHTIDWTYWGSFSQEWHEACKNIKFVPAGLVSFLEAKDYEGRVILPSNLLRSLQNQFKDLDILGLNTKDEVTFIPTENVSQILLDKVTDALAFLLKTRYKYRLINPEILYGKFTDAHTLAQAKNEKILLSTKLDTYDVNAIAKIIIEENEHIKSGFDDETRDFQNHLFDLYFDEMASQLLR